MRKRLVWPLVLGLFVPAALAEQAAPAEVLTNLEFFRDLELFSNLELVENGFGGQAVEASTAAAKGTEVASSSGTVRISTATGGGL
jgi:hypothetical protein